MAVITVSREYGSRGAKIAQQTAQKLGYSYFDKEILTQVAQAADTTEEKISKFDEKEEHGFRYFLKKLFLPDYPQFVHYSYMYYPGIPVEHGWEPIEPGRILKEKDVVAFFRQVVEKVHKRNNVVIMGRGSQHILAGKRDTLHVRFIGYPSDRRQEVMEREEVNFDEALKRVEAIDKQRAHYLKHHYDADWDDPRHYHLVINTSRLNDEQAVDVIAAAVKNLQTE